MKDEIETLLKSIKNKNNPSIIADQISSFIINSFRAEKISLYEAYIVNMEAIKFKRSAYIQPAWNERVRISMCLTLLNQKLLAHIFDDNLVALKVKELAMEAFNLNREKRTHFIMDKYSAFLEANTNCQLLREMLNMRRNYERLSDDEGPFHNETFPYNFYSPEEILLNEDEKRKYLSCKTLSEDIEELIVELSIFEL